MTWGESPHPQPVLRRRSPATSFVALAVGFVVIACFAAAVVVYFITVLPTEVLLIGILLAVVPLLIVLCGVWLVDRWEPEPRVALVFAFFWGAGVSVGAALFFDFAVQTLQSALGSGGSVGGSGGGSGSGDGQGAASRSTADILGAVVQAPVVEEIAKGLGVLLVLWIFRRTFDGPIDGIVYAATVAAGFAFVENIQYFSVQVVDQAYGGESVAGVFLVRALMAPFGHIIYTSCVGFALGVAARRTGALGALGYFAIGLVPAMLLHALWNGALVIVGDRFLAYYVLVQVPIFIACVVLVFVLRHLERRVTRLRLADYASAGWFDGAEVAMLSSGSARRRAQRWAKYNGLGRIMAGYISDATRLASTRQKILSMRHSASGRAAAQRDEHELLGAIAAARPYLQAPMQRGPAPAGPANGQWAGRPSGMPAWAEPNPGMRRPDVDPG